MWNEITRAYHLGLLNGPRPFAKNTWFVGASPAQGLKNRVPTLTAAVARMQSGDMAFVSPGNYNETAVVTIPRSLNNITIVGSGSRGAITVDPSVEDQAGMIVHADDVTLVNLGIFAEDISTASALTVTGARFNALGCTFGNGLTQLTLGPGTAAQVTAGSRGTAADCTFENCEFRDGTNGVILTATDYGAIVNPRFIGCNFSRLTASSFEETGGTISARWDNLLIKDCIFELLASGSAPTAWILLNDDNGNSGLVTGCRFPTAIAGGKNLISTTALWIGNIHTAGIAAAQPS